MSSRSPICPELTMRECEVAHSGAIAHIRNIIFKLDLNNRVQLTLYVLKSGLVRLEDI